MKLRYEGENSCVVHGIVNDQGGNGISLVKGQTFECSASIAANLMSRFNVDGFPAKFIEVAVGRPPKSKAEPETNKMVDDLTVKHN